jgi:hypothetical protein
MESSSPDGSHARRREPSVRHHPSVSLASLLRAGRGPVWDWFETNLPETRRVCTNANRELRGGGAKEPCAVPPVPGADRGLVGTSVGYRLSAHLRPDALDHTVATDAARPPTFPGRFTTSGHRNAHSSPMRSPAKQIDPGILAYAMPGPAPDFRIRLRPGTQPEHAINVLGNRTMALRNLPGETPGNWRPVEYFLARRDRYLAWVEDTEVELGNLTHPDAVADLLHTQRYWAIRDADPQAPRPIPLIESEIRAQQESLHRVGTDLERRLVRAREAPGHITVLDTNTLLHYQLPDSVNWIEVVGHGQVRLVIPLRVIEELDSKKHGDSVKLRARARDLLPRIVEMTGAGGTPSVIAEAVTLEVPVELTAGRSRVRPLDADEEILDTCRELGELSLQAEDVTLVTADTAVRLRAETLGGIRPISLPDKLLRDP